MSDWQYLVDPLAVEAVRRAEVDDPYGRGQKKLPHGYARVKKWKQKHDKADGEGTQTASLMGQ